MSGAYYNENDEFAASWLRNLIKAGLIADGEVDTRSIVDVPPGDLRAFTQCHFFAGIGGWSYALRRAGWADSSPVWTGSCPCQPFSLAGAQRGFADERHLWPIWRELIRECGPAIVFGEQVASATEWLGLVRSDLEAMGRAVGAMPIQAASSGADHLRDRYWFVAYAADTGSQGRRLLPERACERLAGPNGLADAASERGCWWASDSSRTTRRESAEIDGCDVGISDSGGWPEGQQVATPSRYGYPIVPAGRGDMADAMRDGAGDGTGSGDRAQGAPIRIDGDASWSGAAAAGINGTDLEWVIGADGKARRVKSGVRLLAHGVPNRVGLLRGFGNAIDHRPAAAFIAAARDAMSALSVSSQNCGGQK